jgi:hypothetical protein
MEFCIEPKRKTNNNCFFVIIYSDAFVACPFSFAQPHFPWARVLDTHHTRVLNVVFVPQLSIREARNVPSTRHIEVEQGQRKCTFL